MQINKPGVERVQALTDVSRSALCCHSNETRVLIVNQCTTRGNPYHSPKLHPGPCSCVGSWERSEGQTDT